MSGFSIAKKFRDPTFADVMEQTPDAGKQTVVDFGYKPRPFQQYVHAKLKRFSILVCHRRFGKTVMSIAECYDRAVRNELAYPQYAYVAPTYGQAKRVAWEYFKQWARKFPKELVHIHEGELRIDIMRPDKGDFIRFMLLGSENPDSIRGIYLDGVILDEYAQCDPTIWSQVIRAALSDRKGWAIFIGTPKGQNHFYDIYNAMLGRSSWYVGIFKASQTGVVDAEELEDARMSMKEEEYEQEYECSFAAALVGAYYAKYLNDLENQNRVRDIPYEPSVPVSTYWDLGMSDSTAIWFVQRVGREFRVIDYLQDSGKGLEFYAKALKDKPYVYDEHWIPHDGAARELGTGVSRQETLAKFGIRAKIAPKLSKDDCINAVRLILPLCWFNEHKTKHGYSCLKNYQRKFDSKKNMFEDKPAHDWSSHGADAFATFAVVTNPDRGTNTSDLRKYQVLSDEYDPLA